MRRPSHQAKGRCLPITWVTTSIIISNTSCQNFEQCGYIVHIIFHTVYFLGQYNKPYIPPGGLQRELSPWHRIPMASHPSIIVSIAHSVNDTILRAFRHRSRFGYFTVSITSSQPLLFILPTRRLLFLLQLNKLIDIIPRLSILIFLPILALLNA